MQFSIVLFLFMGLWHQLYTIQHRCSSLLSYFCLWGCDINCILYSIDAVLYCPVPVNGVVTLTVLYSIDVVLYCHVPVYEVVTFNGIVYTIQYRYISPLSCSCLVGCDINCILYSIDAVLYCPIPVYGVVTPTVHYKV